MTTVLHEHPGFLFVAATLLPLASFTILVLLGAVRWYLKPLAADNAGVRGVYEALGGAVPGKGPAYVALGAIFLSFVCSLTGFVWYFIDHHHVEHHVHELHEKEKAFKADAAALTKKLAKLEGEEADAARNERYKARKDAKDLHNEIHQEEHAFQHRWSGSIRWAWVMPASLTTKEVGRDPHGAEMDKDAPATHFRDPAHGTELRIGFFIDTLLGVMFVMVSFIATLIHLFSMGYMKDELDKVVEDHQVHAPGGHYHRRGRFGRFFMYLSLFCFSMFNLILADNLFQVFLSWELVGVCSFLLISFYFERQSASNAANKAFIVNRVGDAGFIVGLLILFTQVGSFNFQEIFTRLRAPDHDAHGKFDGKVLVDTKEVPAPNPKAKKDQKQLLVEVDDERKQYIQRIVPVEKVGETPGGIEVTVHPPGHVGTHVLLWPKRQGHMHFDNLAEPMDVRDHPLYYADEKHRLPGNTAPLVSDDIGYMPYWMLVLAGLGVFLGCVGKSAQFPLHVWLPDAMEGPTPVSALIHAATMVAAGVYLVGRVFPIFLPEVLLVIAYTGGITLFVAATTAIVMTDIKKVLAYSTVSQLGYMMLALGVGGWVGGLLHLITHAFFKALLFLGSGSVIYGCHHEHDMGKMGGLYPKMKITALTMLAGVFAICGIPLFSGWYSKDAILSQALAFYLVHPQHILLFLLPLATAGITTFYMFRMWFMTFAGEPRDRHVYDHAHESPWMMTVPLILLAIFSVCVAWGNPIYDAEASWLEHQLHHTMPAAVDRDFEREFAAAKEFHTHQNAGYLALGMVGLGLAFAMALYYWKVLEPSDAKEQFLGVHRFLDHKWYFDEFYSAAIVRPGLTVAHWCRNFDGWVIDGFVNAWAAVTLVVSRWHGMFDRGIVDGLVNVIADVWYSIGAWLRNVQTGYLRTYVLFLVLAAVAIFMGLAFFLGDTSAGR